MRASGAVEAAVGLGEHDHLCWVYDDPDDYHRGAAEFLQDGVDLGLRVGYLGSGPVETISHELHRDERFAELLGHPAFSIGSLDPVYGDGRPVNPDDAVAAYAEATRSALGEGFRGLRVSVEATSLVASAPQRGAFTRYEHLVDRYMTTHPFSAVCAYRGSTLGGEAASELACLHPLSRGASSPFQLFATPDGIGLQGEVDLAGWDLLESALERMVWGESSHPVVDVGRLEFIDHRGLQILDRWAGRAAGGASLRSPSSLVRCLASVVALEHLRLEARGS